MDLWRHASLTRAWPGEAADLGWPPGSGHCPKLCLVLQFVQVPYTALTRLLTPNPKERDSATAYRECRQACSWVGGGSPAQPQELSHLAACCVPGMTLEMAGTLMGATIHGLIVSGAHGSHRCKEDVLPGEVAVSPNAVSVQAARSPWGPRFEVTSFFEEQVSARSLRGCLGAQPCPAGSCIPSLLLVLSPCPPSSR